VKAEELRELDAEELSGRLKGARRELYELRFKMAVGQLDNPQQIGRVRKDIARILTVVHERRLDEAVAQAYSGAQAIVVEQPAPATSEETPEQVEAEAPAATATATVEAEVADAPEAEAEAEATEPVVAEEAPAPKPRRSRKKAASDDADKDEKE
jgi:large subunit ribosomal protein L29